MKAIGLFAPIFVCVVPLVSSAQIAVVRGSYGPNCRAPAGNVTAHLAATCNGRASCDYRVDHRVIGDPAFGCPKNYIAEWRCGANPHVQRVGAPAEASGNTIPLRCGNVIGPNVSPGGVHVLSAIYGGNCGRPANVAGHLAAQCNGRPSCSYTVDVSNIGDPAPGCAKGYVASWQCYGSPGVRSASLPAEAHRRVLVLSCSGTAGGGSGLGQVDQQIATQVARLQQVAAQLQAMLVQLRQQPALSPIQQVLAYQQSQLLAAQLERVRQLTQEMLRSQQVLRASPSRAAIGSEQQRLGQTSDRMRAMVSALQQSAESARYVSPQLQQKMQDIQQKVKSMGQSQQSLSDVMRKLIQSMP